MRYIKTPFANSGDKIAVPVQQQSSGLVSMEAGYTYDYERDKDTDPDAKPIERQKMNYLLNLVMECIQQYQQNGVPDYIQPEDNGGVAFSYSVYARVRYTDGEIYQSMKDNNTDLPTVKPSWRLDRGVDYDQIYPIGIAIFFASNIDPNTAFPGTEWRYTGENKTVRLAKYDGSDVSTTGGSDSVALSTTNLPSHNHSFSAGTTAFDYGTRAVSSFDHGTKATNTTGNHTHPIAGGYCTLQGGSASWVDGHFMTNLFHSTDASGMHSHTVGIGAHNHTVGIGAHSHSVSGTTSSAGSGSAFSVTNSYIKLMCWYRSA
ncbi:phage tail protein [Jinshanibacter sp. LJY008]|uniref:Phage tail protein n=1 Tax=Limnobaculum eriocheiris TaxID=2897391 RepID=A0A9X1MUK7_9GAMM|nr:phage tail protein [Limnobaculum eriocheiris]MCD1124798.1 phage tail protein [Limnobaculum eriocheiris]